MVDEYQDTNTVQEALVLLLAGHADGERAPNLCVVGDDDQGLYRFRGATIRNILEFPELFEDGACRSVRLATNYRSHPDIVRFFGQWMEELEWTGQSPGAVHERPFRYEKTIRPHDGPFPAGPAAVRVAGGSTEAAWHGEVLAFLHHLRDEGTLEDWNQVAFLFRSVKNRKVVALAEFLEANGVPVYSPRSNLFFDREEVRLMVGALLFLFPQAERAMKEGWPGAHEPSVWGYYGECARAFAEAVRADPERHRELLRWARHRAHAHLHLTEATDYAFSGLFYELLQFPMFARLAGRRGARRGPGRPTGAEPGAVLEAADQVRVRPRGGRPHARLPRRPPRADVERVPPVLAGRRDRRVRGPDGAGAERVRLVHDGPPGEGAGVSRRARGVAGGRAAGAALGLRRDAPDGALREATVRAVRPDQVLRLLAAVLHGVLARAERAGADGAGPAERARAGAVALLPRRGGRVA